MIKTTGKYYLYRHIRLDNNQPFYIGIGTKYEKFAPSEEYRRAYNKIGRSCWWKKVINKTNYKVEILLESDNYEFIQEKEIEFIKLYGRKDLEEGILVNLTDGGYNISDLFFNKTGIKLRGYSILSQNKKDKKERIYKLKKKYRSYHKKKYPELSRSEISKLYAVPNSMKARIKVVYAFDYLKQSLGMFNSITKASLQLGVDGSSISKSCKTGICVDKIYYFSYTKDLFINTPSRVKIIEQYDENMNFIANFPCAKYVKEKHPEIITKVLSKAILEKYLYMGFNWKYKQN
jgi:hypothetical protein